MDLGPLDLPSAWEKQAPTLVDLKYMLHQQDFDDPDEKAAAAWLRSSGFSVQRLGRFKRQQGRRSPDARCKKGSREETIEFKAHHGQSAETAAARIAEGSGQSPRVLLQLTREKTWSRADVMRLMIDGITDATAELLEVVVWTPEFVVKWTKAVGPS